MAIFQQAVFKAGAARSSDTHVTTSQVPADERPQPGGLNSKDAVSPTAGGWPSKLSVSSQLPCRHPTLPVAGRAWASWLVAAWLQALPLPFPVSGLRMAFSVPGVHLWTPDTPGECVSKSLSVEFHSSPPHGLHSPWNSPGQNTGVGGLPLLRGIFPTQGSNPGLPHCRRIFYHLSHQGNPGEGPTQIQPHGPLTDVLIISTKALSPVRCPPQTDTWIS